MNRFSPFVLISVVFLGLLPAAALPQENPFQASADSVYIEIDGATAIKAFDDAGHMTSTEPEDFGKAEPVPGLLALNPAGETSWSLILLDRTKFRIAMRTASDTISVQALVGRSNVLPRAATRFIDIPMTPGHLAELDVEA